MIFVDTTYFISVIVPNDQWNNTAKNINIPKSETIVINNLVLTEVLNLVSKRTELNIHDIYNLINDTVEVVCLDNDDYLKALDYCTFYHINYSDCLILSTMEKLGINKIITFDEGFRKVNGLKIIN